MAERVQLVHEAARRNRTEKPDHRQCRLLRAHGERPRRCRTTKPRDELAPPHHGKTRPWSPGDPVRSESKLAYSPKAAQARNRALLTPADGLHLALKRPSTPPPEGPLTEMLP